MTEENKTDNLIDELCGDLETVKPSGLYKHMVLWLGLAVVYVAIIVFSMGLKVDLSQKLSDAAFLFEMAMAIALLITSALASAFLSYPDEMQKGWVKVVATTLFSAFVLWIVVNAYEEGFSFDAFALGSCYRSLLVEALPFITIIVLTIKGRSTKPYWLMTMNVFAVTALGWIGLRVTCSMYDSMLYGFFHYLLPFAILSTAVGFFARKIFKW